MSRILVFGAAPLPFEAQRKQYAANLRTWHFTEPLLADGHEVCLVACRLPETYFPEDDIAPVTKTVDPEYNGRFTYYSVKEVIFEDAGFVRNVYEEFKPDAILGVNTYPSYRAVRVETDKPVWCDLNGWVMAEAQAKSYVYSDDAYLSHFWKMEEAIIDRADAISCVSQAQVHATLGELAVRGRLGCKNFGYEFAHRVPNAIIALDYEHTENVVRGKLVPEDAFIVLWTGGYNTWTDVDMLYDGLAAAMKALPNMHYVSTGGAITGHDEITFNKFMEQIKGSDFVDRCHFAGWVPTSSMPNYYFESDLGLNIDSNNYETIFGARNRLNDFMKSGLAVFTTLGTEISEITAEHELGLTGPLGDAGIFSEKIIWAANNKDELKRMAEKALKFVEVEFSYAKTTEPMRAWAKEPQRAPDNGERVQFEDISFLHQPPPPSIWQRMKGHYQAGGITGVLRKAKQFIFG